MCVLKFISSIFVYFYKFLFPKFKAFYAKSYKSNIFFSNSTDIRMKSMDVMITFATG